MKFHACVVLSSIQGLLHDPIWEVPVSAKKLPYHLGCDSNFDICMPVLCLDTVVEKVKLETGEGYGLPTEICRIIPSL